MTKHDLAKAAARILFVSAWADYEERMGRNYPGCELTDEAPETPQATVYLAYELLGGVAVANCASVWSLIEQAKKADRAAGSQIDDADAYAERFAECMAFMAMGSGVSWFDDHEKFLGMFNDRPYSVPGVVVDLDPSDWGQEPEPHPEDGESVWVWGPNTTRAGEVYQGDRITDDVFCYGVNRAEAIDNARYAINRLGKETSPDAMRAVREARAVLAFCDAEETPLHATFVPQVWVNDYAMQADPQGPVTWNLSPEFAARVRELEDPYAISTDLDFLREDPNAYAWFREWSGPFEIELEETE